MHDVCLHILHCVAIFSCILIFFLKKEMEKEEGGVRKGAWTKEEDLLLTKCVQDYGEGKWYLVPLRAGLNRCRKSCRMRWLNYLRPNLKRGQFAEDEVDLIVRMHKLLGNRWSLIAGRLPGRTANDIKNFWNLVHNSKNKLLLPSPPSICTSATDPTSSSYSSNIIKPKPRYLTSSTFPISLFNKNNTSSPSSSSSLSLMISPHTAAAGDGGQNLNDHKNKQIICSPPPAPPLMVDEQGSKEESIRWWTNMLQMSSDQHGNPNFFFNPNPNPNPNPNAMLPISNSPQDFNLDLDLDVSFLEQFDVCEDI